LNSNERKKERERERERWIEMSVQKDGSNEQKKGKQNGITVTQQASNSTTNSYSLTCYITQHVCIEITIIINDACLPAGGLLLELLESSRVESGRIRKNENINSTLIEINRQHVTNHDCLHERRTSSSY